MKRLFFLVAAIGLLLSLTACASGASNSEVLNLTIKAKDIALDVTSFEAKQGQTVNLTYTNDGALEHNFILEEFNVETKILPGESTIITFTANQAGTFKYHCTIPGHTEAGMVGELTVTP